MSKEPGTVDYRDLRKPGEPRPERMLLGQTSRRWWEMKGADCAGSIRSTVEFLQKNQQARLRQQVASARLYGNIQLSGGTGAAYTRLLQSQTAVKDRVTYNAIQSIIDTLVSRIGENKPRPYFLTSGGSWRQQLRAKKLNQFIEGVFYETSTYDVGMKAFRDAAIWGDGFVHVFGRGGRICHERVMPSELWVDEVEAQYGAPRNMHRLKLVDRDELASYFPERRDVILEASRSSDKQGTGTQNIADMLTVVESWHLGAVNDDGELEGGVHCISLPSSETMLVEPEEWPHPFFPFARISWCERPVGYWSQGLCEQLQGEQLELNKELWLIQRSMHLAGTVKVFLKNGSQVSKEHVNNEVGAIITYTGDAPTFFVPQPVHQMLFENPQRIIERMYRHAGVSEMSASARKPAGLNSGRALREAEDIESDRHKSIARANDNLYLAIAKLDVAIAKELSKTGKLEKVRVPGARRVALIDWKRDVGNFDEGDMVTQCFPVSRLPRDPAGRLQTIQEYVQAGMMTQRQGRRALDFPDLDAIESLANAQEDIITSVLDLIVEEGAYAPPEPTDDLGLAKEMVVEYIQRFRSLDLEPERMTMLRAWNGAVDELMRRAMPPAPPSLQPPVAGPGAGSSPQALPMAPPRSDLLPNAPGAAPQA